MSQLKRDTSNFRFVQIHKSDRQTAAAGAEKTQSQLALESQAAVAARQPGSRRGGDPYNAVGTRIVTKTG
jgi:hypothetical protein